MSKKDTEHNQGGLPTDTSFSSAYLRDVLCSVNSQEQRILQEDRTKLLLSAFALIVRTAVPRIEGNNSRIPTTVYETPPFSLPEFTDLSVRLAHTTNDHLVNTRQDRTVRVELDGFTGLNLVEQYPIFTIDLDTVKNWKGEEATREEVLAALQIVGDMDKALPDASVKEEKRKKAVFKGKGYPIDTEKFRCFLKERALTQTEAAKGVAHPSYFGQLAAGIADHVGEAFAVRFMEKYNIDISNFAPDPKE